MDALTTPPSANAPACEALVDDQRYLTCPWCFEAVEMYIDPQTTGEMVEDCAVCCRPWRLRVSRDWEGELYVEVDRGNE